MADFQLKTPVAFIIFNRPDATERVFAEIARAKPPKLLVVADGARNTRYGEAAKVASVRSIIKRIDWPCDVLTNFSDDNLGCKRRVSSGLDWVFEQVEEAIILEDDCLPHPSFFRFCEEMLLYYRYDQRISQICGNNFQFGYKLNSDSYYFSKHSHIWGWASWRDRWKNDYDVEMREWQNIKDAKRVTDLFSPSMNKRKWTKLFDDIQHGKVDTWDYQLYFSLLFNGRLSIIPNSNLISNIGFGPEATHTIINGPTANMTVDGINFPITHPKGVYACNTLDIRYMKLITPSKFSLFNSVRRVISNYIKKFLY